MKLDFNFDGKTLLKKWWQQVKSNFQTVQDEYNALEDNLSEEINQRVNIGNRSEEHTSELQSPS